jgi:hypothetical protein
MQQEDLEQEPPRKATRRAQRMTSDDTYKYENISQLPPGAISRHGSYTVAAGRTNVFISFEKKDFDLDAQKTLHGWKFHISLNDEDFNNVAKGWNILYKILIKHGINASKVVKNGVKLAEGDENQRGKQITIYQHFNPDSDWKTILTEITDEFKKSGIEPGYAPPSDRPVPGTNYIYYRTDASESSEYKKGGDAPTAPNLVFDKLTIEVGNQLPVKEWNVRQSFKHSK